MFCFHFLTFLFFIFLLFIGFVGNSIFNLFTVLCLLLFLCIDSWTQSLFEYLEFSFFSLWFHFCFSLLFFSFWCSHVWLSLIIFIFKNERWHLVQASPLLNWFPIAFLIGCSMEWKFWDGVVYTNGSLWNGRFSCKMKWCGDGCQVGFLQKWEWENFTVGTS